MNTKPVPEPWAESMRKLGFTHRGEPSISALARAADISVETARRFLHHIGEADAATVAALSEAMRQDVSSWVGSKSAGEPYVGPDASRWLDERQRQALTEIINAFLAKGVQDGPAPDAQKRPERGGVEAIAGGEMTELDPPHRSTGDGQAPHPSDLQAEQNNR